MFKINTERPFRVRLEFVMSVEGSFNGINTILTQGRRQVEMSSGECYYLQDLTNVLAGGMSFVVNNMMGDDEFFRKDRCEGDCSVNPDETIGNIVITQGRQSQSQQEPTLIDTNN